MEQLNAGSWADVVSKTAVSFVVDVWLVLVDEETINGRGYWHEALRKFGPCRVGRKLNCHMFFGSMI